VAVIMKLCSSLFTVHYFLGISDVLLSECHIIMVTAVTRNTAVTIFNHPWLTKRRIGEFTNHIAPITSN